MHRILVLFGLLAAVYTLLVRPWLVRWGATDAEARGPYPGEALVPGGDRSPTMATTIDAPPADVWPWLVQMGYGRAGWYSWDHLDNWGHKSSSRLHPEWQSISLGDRLPSMPNEAAWWEVAALEPGRFLGLRTEMDLRGRPIDARRKRPRFFTDSLWGFRLEELPGGRTRLVVSGYWAMRPRWAKAIVNLVFLEPAHWVMQTRQFAILKRNVAREQQRLAPAQATAAKGDLAPEDIPAAVAT